MTVLIADKFPASQTEALQGSGCTVVVDPALQGAQLVEAIRREEPEVLREGV